MVAMSRRGWSGVSVGWRWFGVTFDLRDWRLGRDVIPLHDGRLVRWYCGPVQGWRFRS